MNKDYWLAETGTVIKRGRELLNLGCWFTTSILILMKADFKDPPEIRLMKTLVRPGFSDLMIRYFPSIERWSNTP